jgi:hypothetical protein
MFDSLNSPPNSCGLYLHYSHSWKLPFSLKENTILLCCRVTKLAWEATEATLLPNRRTQRAC